MPVLRGLNLENLLKSRCNYEIVTKPQYRYGLDCSSYHFWGQSGKCIVSCSFVVV